MLKQALAGDLSDPLVLGFARALAAEVAGGDAEAVALVSAARSPSSGHARHATTEASAATAKTLRSYAPVYDLTNAPGGG